MKNLFLLLTIVSLFAFNTKAQEEEKPNPDAAVMDFEYENYDFGDIVEGSDAQVDFNFTNTGKQKLIISNVKASCGCTTPFWSKEPVLPGEPGKITAKYNTKGRVGRFNKAITISSNAQTPTKRLFIKGNVIKAPADDGVPERTPSIVNDLSAE